MALQFSSQAAGSRNNLLSFGGSWHRSKLHGQISRLLRPDEVFLIGPLDQTEVPPSPLDLCSDES